MLCGGEVFDDSGICNQCTSLMPLNNGKTCIRCGASLAGQEEYCINCSNGNDNIDRAHSVYVYEGVVPRLIQSVKFHGRADCTEVFAHLLAELSRQRNLRYDIVCSVAMTNKSKKLRGYNQSKLLAQYYCDIMDVQYCDALVKVKQTLPQEGLTRKQRRENLVRAFSAHKDMVSGKRILLIDDVMTTGATLDSCAYALKRVGAISVVGLTVASGEYKLTMEDNDGSIY